MTSITFSETEYTSPVSETQVTEVGTLKEYMDIIQIASLSDKDIGENNDTFIKDENNSLLKLAGEKMNISSSQGKALVSSMDVVRNTSDLDEISDTVAHHTSYSHSTSEAWKPHDTSSTGLVDTEQDRRSSKHENFHKASGKQKIFVGKTKRERDLISTYSATPTLVTPIKIVGPKQTSNETVSRRKQFDQLRSVSEPAYVSIYSKRLKRRSLTSYDSTSFCKRLKAESKTQAKPASPQTSLQCTKQVVAHPMSQITEIVCSQVENTEPEMYVVQSNESSLPKQVLDEEERLSIYSITETEKDTHQILVSEDGQSQHLVTSNVVTSNDASSVPSEKDLNIIQALSSKSNTQIIQRMIADQVNNTILTAMAKVISLATEPIAARQASGEKLLELKTEQHMGLQCNDFTSDVSDYSTDDPKIPLKRKDTRSMTDEEPDTELVGVEVCETESLEQNEREKETTNTVDSILIAQEETPKNNDEDISSLREVVAPWIISDLVGQPEEAYVVSDTLYNAGTEEDLNYQHATPRESHADQLSESKIDLEEPDETNNDRDSRRLSSQLSADIDIPCTEVKESSSKYDVTPEPLHIPDQANLISGTQYSTFLQEEIFLQLTAPEASSAQSYPTSVINMKESDIPSCVQTKFSSHQFESKEILDKEYDFTLGRIVPKRGTHSDETVEFNDIRYNVLAKENINVPLAAPTEHEMQQHSPHAVFTEEGKLPEKDRHTNTQPSGSVADHLEQILYNTSIQEEKNSQMTGPLVSKTSRYSAEVVNKNDTNTQKVASLEAKSSEFTKASYKKYAISTHLEETTAKRDAGEELIKSQQSTSEADALGEVLCSTSAQQETHPTMTAPLVHKTSMYSTSVVKLEENTGLTTNQDTLPGDVKSPEYESSQTSNKRYDTPSRQDKVKAEKDTDEELTKCQQSTSEAGAFEEVMYNTSAQQEIDATMTAPLVHKISMYSTSVVNLDENTELPTDQDTPSGDAKSPEYESSQISNERYNTPTRQDKVKAEKDTDEELTKCQQSISEAGDLEQVLYNTPIQEETNSQMTAPLVGKPSRHSAEMVNVEQNTELAVKEDVNIQKTTSSEAKSPECTVSKASDTRCDISTHLDETKVEKDTDEEITNTQQSTSEAGRLEKVSYNTSTQETNNPKITAPLVSTTSRHSADVANVKQNTKLPAKEDVHIQKVTSSEEKSSRLSDTRHDILTQLDATTPETDTGEELTKPEQLTSETGYLEDTPAHQDTTPQMAASLINTTSIHSTIALNLEPNEDMNLGDVPSFVSDKRHDISTQENETEAEKDAICDTSTDDDAELQLAAPTEHETRHKLTVKEKEQTTDEDTGKEVTKSEESPSEVNRLEEDLHNTPTQEETNFKMTANVVNLEQNTELPANVNVNLKDSPSAKSPEHTNSQTFDKIDDTVYGRMETVKATEYSASTQEENYLQLKAPSMTQTERQSSSVVTLQDRTETVTVFPSTSEPKSTEKRETIHDVTIKEMEHITDEDTGEELTKSEQSPSEVNYLEEVLYNTPTREETKLQMTANVVNLEQSTELPANVDKDSPSAKSLEHTNSQTLDKIDDIVHDRMEAVKDTEYSVSTQEENYPQLKAPPATWTEKQASSVVTLQERTETATVPPTPKPKSTAKSSDALSTNVKLPKIDSVETNNIHLDNDISECDSDLDEAHIMEDITCNTSTQDENNPQLMAPLCTKTEEYSVDVVTLKDINPVMHVPKTSVNSDNELADIDATVEDVRSETTYEGPLQLGYELQADDRKNKDTDNTKDEPSTFSDKTDFMEDMVHSVPTQNLSFSLLTAPSVAETTTKCESEKVQTSINTEPVSVPTSTVAVSTSAIPTILNPSRGDMEPASHDDDKITNEMEETIVKRNISQGMGVTAEKELLSNEGKLCQKHTDDVLNKLQQTTSEADRLEQVLYNIHTQDGTNSQMTAPLVSKHSADVVKIEVKETGTGSAETKFYVDEKSSERTTEDSFTEHKTNLDEVRNETSHERKDLEEANILQSTTYNISTQGENNFQLTVPSCGKTEKYSTSVLPLETTTDAPTAQTSTAPYMEDKVFGRCSTGVEPPATEKDNTIENTPTNDRPSTQQKSAACESETKTNQQVAANVSSNQDKSEVVSHLYELNDRRQLAVPSSTKLEELPASVLTLEHKTRTSNNTKTDANLSNDENTTNFESPATETDVTVNRSVEEIVNNIPTQEDPNQGLDTVCVNETRSLSANEANVLLNFGDETSGNDDLDARISDHTETPKDVLSHVDEINAIEDKTYSTQDDNSRLKEPGCNTTEGLSVTVLSTDQESETPTDIIDTGESCADYEATLERTTNETSAYRADLNENKISVQDQPSGNISVPTGEFMVSSVATRSREMEIDASLPETNFNAKLSEENVCTETLCTEPKSSVDEVTKKTRDECADLGLDNILKNMTHDITAQDENNLELITSSCDKTEKHLANVLSSEKMPAGDRTSTLSKGSMEDKVLSTNDLTGAEPQELQIDNIENAIYGILTDTSKDFTSRPSLEPSAIETGTGSGAIENATNSISAQVQLNQKQGMVCVSETTHSATEQVGTVVSPDSVSTKVESKGSKQDALLSEAVPTDIKNSIEGISDEANASEGTACSTFTEDENIVPLLCSSEKKIKTSGHVLTLASPDETGSASHEDVIPTNIKSLEKTARETESKGIMSENLENDIILTPRDVYLNDISEMSTQDMINNTITQLPAVDEPDMTKGNEDSPRESSEESTDISEVDNSIEVQHNASTNVPVDVADHTESNGSNKTLLFTSKSTDDNEMSSRQTDKTISQMIPTAEQTIADELHIETFPEPEIIPDTACDLGQPSEQSLSAVNLSESKIIDVTEVQTNDLPVSENKLKVQTIRIPKSLPSDNALSAYAASIKEIYDRERGTEALAYSEEQLFTPCSRNTSKLSSTDHQSLLGDIVAGILSEVKTRLNESEEEGTNKPLSGDILNEISNACEGKLTQAICSLSEGLVGAVKTDSETQDTNDDKMNKIIQQMTEIKTAAQDVFDMLRQYTEDLLCNYLTGKIVSHSKLDKSKHPSEESIRASIRGVSSQILTDVIKKTSPEKLLNSSCSDGAFIVETIDSCSTIFSSQSSDVLSPAIHDAIYNTSQNNTDQSDSDMEDQPEPEPGDFKNDNEMPCHTTSSSMDEKQKTRDKENFENDREMPHHTGGSMIESLENDKEISHHTKYSQERPSTVRKCGAVEEDIVAETTSPVDLLTVAETQTPCESMVGSTHTLRSEVFQTSSVGAFTDDDSFRSDNDSPAIDVSSINLEDISNSVDQSLALPSKSTESVKSGSSDRLVEVVKDVIGQLCQKESPTRGKNKDKNTLYISDEKLVDEILDKILNASGTYSRRKTDKILHDVGSKGGTEQYELVTQIDAAGQTQTKPTESEVFDQNACLIAEYIAGTTFSSSCELNKQLSTNLVTPTNPSGTDVDSVNVPIASNSEPQVNRKESTSHEHADNVLELSVHEMKEVISNTVKEILKRYRSDISNETSSSSNVKSTAELQNSCTVHNSRSSPEENLSTMSVDKLESIPREEVSLIELTVYSSIDASVVKSELEKSSSCVIVPELYAPTSVSELETMVVKDNKEARSTENLAESKTLVFLEPNYPCVEAISEINANNITIITNHGVVAVEEKVEPMKYEQLYQRIEPTHLTGEDIQTNKPAAVLKTYSVVSVDQGFTGETIVMVNDGTNFLSKEATEVTLIDEFNECKNVSVEILKDSINVSNNELVELDLPSETMSCESDAAECNLQGSQPGELSSDHGRLLTAKVSSFVDQILTIVKQTLAEFDSKETISKINRVENMLQGVINTTDNMKRDIRTVKEEVCYISTMIRTQMITPNDRTLKDNNNTEHPIRCESSESQEGTESCEPSNEGMVEDFSDVSQKCSLIDAVTTELLCRGIDVNQPLYFSNESSEKDIDDEVLFVLAAIAALTLVFMIEDSTIGTVTNIGSSPLASLRGDYQSPSLDSVRTDGSTVTLIRDVSSTDLEPVIYETLLKAANSIADARTRESAELIVKDTEHFVESYSRQSSSEELTRTAEENISYMELSYNELRTERIAKQYDYPELKQNIEERKEQSELGITESDLGLKDIIDSVIGEAYYMMLSSVSNLQTDDVDQVYEDVKNQDLQATNKDSTSDVQCHKTSQLDIMMHDMENKLFRSVDSLVKEHLQHSRTKSSETNDPEERKERRAEPENIASQNEEEGQELNADTIMSECQLKDVIDHVTARTFQIIFSSNVKEGSSDTAASGSLQDIALNHKDWSDASITQICDTQENNMIVSFTKEKLTQTIENLVKEHLDDSTVNSEDHPEPAKVLSGKNVCEAQESAPKLGQGAVLQTSLLASSTPDHVETEQGVPHAGLEVSSSNLCQSRSGSHNTISVVSSDPVLFCTGGPKVIAIMNHMAENLFDNIDQRSMSDEEFLAEEDINGAETVAKRVTSQVLKGAKEKYHLFMKKMFLYKLVKDMLQSHVDAKLGNLAVSYQIETSKTVGTQTSASSLEQYGFSRYGVTQTLSDALIETAQLRDLFKPTGTSSFTEHPQQVQKDNTSNSQGKRSSEIISQIVEDVINKIGDREERNIRSTVDTIMKEVSYVAEIGRQEKNKLSKRVLGIIHEYLAAEKGYLTSTEDTVDRLVRELVTSTAKSAIFSVDDEEQKLVETNVRDVVEGTISDVRVKHLQDVYEECDVSAHALVFTVLEKGFGAVKCVSAEDVRDAAHNIVSSVTQLALNTHTPVVRFENKVNNIREIFEDLPIKGKVTEKIAGEIIAKPDDVVVGTANVKYQEYTMYQDSETSESDDYSESIEELNDTESSETFTDSYEEIIFDIEEEFEDKDTMSRFFANFEKKKEEIKPRIRSSGMGKRIKNEQYLLIEDIPTEKPDTIKLLEKETNYGKESILRLKGRKPRNTDPNKHVCFDPTLPEFEDDPKDGKVAYNKMFMLAPEKTRLGTTRRLLFDGEREGDLPQEEIFHTDTSNNDGAENNHLNNEINEEDLQPQTSDHVISETTQMLDETAQTEKEEKDFKRQFVTVSGGQRGKFGKKSKSPIEKVKKDVLPFMQEEKVKNTKKDRRQKNKTKDEAEIGTKKKKRSLSDLFKQIGKSKVSAIDESIRHG